MPSLIYPHQTMNSTQQLTIKTNKRKKVFQCLICAMKFFLTILDNSLLTENFENAYLEQKDACESNSNALADARIIELQKIFEEKEQTYHKEKCTLKSQVSNLFYLIFALLC